MDQETARKRLATLAAQIDDGLDSLARVVRQVEKAAQTGDDFGRAGSTAFYLDRFYTAAEDLLLRIALELNGGGPAGEDWHKQLLSQMEKDIPGLRPAVIGHETRCLLDDLRRFRHRVRHAYDEELEWAKMERLLETVTTAQKALISDLEEFKRFLAQLIAGMSSSGPYKQAP